MARLGATNGIVREDETHDGVLLQVGIAVSRGWPTGGRFPGREPRITATLLSGRPTYPVLTVVRGPGKLPVRRPCCNHCRTDRTECRSGGGPGRPARTAHRAGTASRSIGSPSRCKRASLQPSGSVASSFHVSPIQNVVTSSASRLTSNSTPRSLMCKRIDDVFLQHGEVLFLPCC